jgi:hypothetical protein
MGDDEAVLVDVVTLRQPLEEQRAVLGVPVRLADRVPGRLECAGKRPEVRLVRVEPRDPLAGGPGSSSGG